MRKYILSLMALLICMSADAQIIKVYKNNGAEPVDVYTNTETEEYSVVIEEKSALLSGKFSVSDTKKVQFTKGNLRTAPEGSKYKYTFAEHQYDYIGYTNDLLKWETENGAFKDWGVNFPGKGYFTLSCDEWSYLLNLSNATSGARTQTNRFAKARVNGVRGLLIFPDDYNGNTEVTGTGIGAVNVNNNTDFPEESIPSETWTTMESDGVVFLPAAGICYGINPFLCGFDGFYWSSTAESEKKVYCLVFYHVNSQDTGEVVMKQSDSNTHGFAVRLVSAVSE